MPTQRKRELFFRRFDSSRLAKTRAFPSALLRLAKDAPARRRVRSMKPRVISTRKTREVRWRPARARFRTEFVPSECVCYAFFFVQKVPEHARKSGRSQFSLPNGFFPVKRVQQQQQKKRAEKLSSFFESALESARRPSFSSSREGGFFGCRFAVSAMRLIRPRRFFLLLALSKTVPKKRGKNVTVDI